MWIFKDQYDQLVLAMCDSKPIYEPSLDCWVVDGSCCDLWEERHHCAFEISHCQSEFIKNIDVDNLTEPIEVDFKSI